MKSREPLPGTGRLLEPAQISESVIHRTVFSECRTAHAFFNPVQNGILRRGDSLGQFAGVGFMHGRIVQQFPILFRTCGLGRGIHWLLQVIVTHNHAGDNSTKVADVYF